MEKVQLTTSDGFTLECSFTAAQSETPAPACLLVHQLGKDRKTYAEFQQILSRAGIASLAIDMRGHGESTGGAELSHRGFSPEQWEQVKNDFFAGLEYLRNRNGVDPSRLGVVGSSIGANLAVIAIADEMSAGVENPVKSLLLLSPGTRYQGIQPHPRARQLERIPVLIVSSEGDSQSYPGSQSLSQAARNGSLYSIEGRVHGTDLFESESGLMEKLVEWLASVLISGNTSPSVPDA
ncbi:MAG TPA: hypothetical protein ENN67_02640 [Firmicutes bacterium]|nr:hypothetical protein [Bacillota bacterium]